MFLLNVENVVEVVVRTLNGEVHKSTIQTMSGQINRNGRDYVVKFTAFEDII